MAASGSKIVNATFTTKGKECDAVKFSWWEISQSVANNSTVVGWKLELISYQYGYIDSSAKKNWSVTVNGQKFSGTNTIGISANSTRTLASGTTDPIAHNDNGAKSFSYSFTQDFKITFNSYVGTISGSGSGTLTTIARASQPSLITCPENTQNVGYFGDTISVHMNSASSSFTHKVRYEFGSLSGTCIDAETGKEATAVTNGFKWTIPKSLANAIPNSKTGSGRVFVDTYNGSTLIGTKYSGFTAEVPSTTDFTPSGTLTLTDTEGIYATYGYYVQGLSKIKATVSVSLKYGATLNNCSIYVDGRRYNGTEVTTGYLSETGTYWADCLFDDSRGKGSGEMYQITVKEYKKPTISKLSVVRCNQDGTSNKRGAYLKVTFSASATKLVNSKDSSKNNTASYSIEYKKSTAGRYTTVNLSDLANNFAPTNYTYIFSASTGSSYDVVVSAWDKHNSSNPTTRSAKGSTGTAIFSWRGFKNSSTGDYEDGAGIGKVPEKPNTLQVGWDAEFDKKSTFADELVCKGNQYAFSSPGTADSAGYVRIATLTHKKENADTPITFVFTRRLEASPMTVHVQFKSNSTTVDPDLKGITYEGSNYGAFLVHTAESVWDLYVEKVSAYDTITLQHWFSSGTVCDRLTVTFPGDLVSAVPEGLDGYFRATPTIPQSILDAFMPVGYVLTLWDDHLPNKAKMNPNVMYPGTTWARIENRFLWATTEGGEIGHEGGESTHTLTIDEMPSHSHSFNSNVHWDATDGTYANFRTGSNKNDYGKNNLNTAAVGGGKAHNNMPPYVQVSMWHRTA